MRKIKRSRDLEFPGLPPNTVARARAHTSGDRESGTKTRKVPGHGAQGFWPDLALPPISISLNDDRRACTRARVTLARRYTRVYAHVRRTRDASCNATRVLESAERRQHEIYKKSPLPPPIASGPSRYRDLALPKGHTKHNVRTP